MAVIEVKDEAKKTYMVKQARQLKGPRSRSIGIGGLFLWPDDDFHPSLPEQGQPRTRE